MTKEELKQASEYEAKAKAIRRAEQKFWSDISSRRDEVISYLGVGQFDELCKRYGVKSDEERADLFSHLTSERQVTYYNKNVRKTPVVNDGLPGQMSITDYKDETMSEVVNGVEGEPLPLGERR